MPKQSSRKPAATPPPATEKLQTGPVVMPAPSNVAALLPEKPAWLTGDVAFAEMMKRIQRVPGQYQGFQARTMEIKAVLEEWGVPGATKRAEGLVAALYPPAGVQGVEWTPAGLQAWVRAKVRNAPRQEMDQVARACDREAAEAAGDTTVPTSGQAVVGGANTEAEPPIADFEDGGAPQEFKRKRKGKGLEEHDADYARLAVAAKGRKAQLPIIVHWVAENLEIPVAVIDPATVPSPSAVSMLRWARWERSGFFGLFGKLMPSKQQVDAQARLTDDGANILALLKSIPQSAAEGESAESMFRRRAAKSPRIREVASEATAGFIG